MTVHLYLKSALIQLNTFLDKDGILRVGRRLSQFPLPTNQIHGIIIDMKSYAAVLLVRRFHKKVQYQGRMFTEDVNDLIISWIVGAKKIINSVMHKCVTADRVAPSPLINIVGVDVFGLWNIVARRTREGLAHSKRGVVLFCCLTSRAVHIEIIEELSSLA